MPDRRKASRREYALIGSILGSGAEKGEPIFIENLCAGGLKFRADATYRAGQTLTVLVPLDGQEFVLPAQVRHCAEDSFGRVTGIQFLDPDQEFVRQLEQLCIFAGTDSELVFA